VICEIQSRKSPQKISSLQSFEAFCNSNNSSENDLSIDEENKSNLNENKVEVKIEITDLQSEIYDDRIALKGGIDKWC